MKVHLQALPLLITALSIAAAGQCAKLGMSPIWDSAKGQFRCTDSSATTRSSQDDSSHPRAIKIFVRTLAKIYKECAQPLMKVKPAETLRSPYLRPATRARTLVAIGPEQPIPHPNQAKPISLFA
jgi:hypothetical protein